MQITCPNCSTSYRIADQAVGAKGRQVRCARCAHSWRVESQPTPAAEAKTETEEAAFRAELGKTKTTIEPAVAPPIVPAAEPPSPASEAPAAEPMSASANGATDTPASDEHVAIPAPAPEPASQAAEEPAPVALADIPIPVENAPPLVPAPGEGAGTAGPPQIENEREDIETVAARRARAEARRRRRLRIPKQLAIAAMLVACTALVGLRKEVVRHVPQLASLYARIGLPVNLRGLDFTEVKIGSEIHDGVPVMVIEGSIVNRVSMPVDVPRLRFSLRSASGAELYAWTAQPGQPVLEPGQSLPFRSRLASPPAEAHDVQVRFFTRRDTIAGLR